MSKQLELFEVLSAEQEQQKSDALNRIIKSHKRRMDLTQKLSNPTMLSVVMVPVQLFVNRSA